MDAVYYESTTKYITSATTLEERLVKVRAVIMGLLDMATTAATSGNFSEYSLDDGQTKIRTVYRNMTEVKAAIKAFMDIEEMLLDMLNNDKFGRVIRLVDGKNMI